MLRSEVANSAQEQFGLRSMNLLHYLPVARRAPLVRELYTAAPRSQRLNVLTEGANFLPEPLSDGFLSWYAGVFRREFEQADKRARDRAGLATSTLGSQRLMRLRLEAVMSMGGKHREWLRLLHIVAELGDGAAVARMLEDGIPAMMTRDDLVGVVPNRPKGLDRRQLDAAVRQLVADGLQEQAVTVVERKLTARPDHEALRYLQWQLRTQMPGAVAFVQAQLADGGDDVDLLELAARFLRSRGHLVDAADVLQRLVERDDERAASWRRQLLSLQRGLGNERAAAAVKPAAPAAASSTSAARTAASSIVGQLFSVIGRSSAASSASPRARALLAQKDPVRAGRDLRRLWRGRGSDRPRLVIGAPTAEIAISEQDLVALAGQPFAAAEATRMRRLLEDAGQLGSSSLLSATLQVQPQPADVAVETRELLAKLAGGEGGTVEAVRLLAAIAGDELSAAVRDEVVDVLLRRREEPDEARLRNVAHELARAGRKEAAADLYRLSVLASGSGVPSYLRRNQKEQPGAVIRDVQARLGDDLGKATAVAMLDDKLATEDSASMMLAALRAWPELLTPAQLASRVGLLQERIARLRRSRLGRFSYDRDAVATVGALCKALVVTGDLDGAMAELEPLLCGEAPDAYGRTPNRNATQVRAALADLLSVDSANRVEWLRAVGARVLGWHDQGRVLAAGEVLPAVGTQLAAAGLEELARQCTAQLAELAQDDAAAEHALAALWRVLGDEVRAYTLEKRLLTGRRLKVTELPRVLLAIRDSEGAPVAFAAGETALPYTTASAFLERMAALADEVGQPERAARWRLQLEDRAKAEAARQSEARGEAAPAGSQAVRKGR